MKKVKKIVVLVIIVILGIAICNLSKKSDNGNLSNMGLVVENDGVTYYNKYEKGIFSVKNGKENQLTDETAYSMNIVKDKIYYLTIADFNNVVIKSVDTNGENLKNIANIYTSISKFFIDDNYIYYSSNKGDGGICRLDLNGENETVIITGNIQDFYVGNGKIFYINDSNQICRASVTGENSYILKDGIIAKRIQIVDDWVYYYNESENALFRLSEDGKKSELVSVLVKTEIYNVAGKYVYYLDKENSKIARMQIGKSNKCDDIVDINISRTKINIADDELYYLDKSQDESQTYQIYRVKVNGDEAKSIEY